MCNYNISDSFFQFVVNSISKSLRDGDNRNAEIVLKWADDLGINYKGTFELDPKDYKEDITDIN